MLSKKGQLTLFIIIAIVAVIAIIFAFFFDSSDLETSLSLNSQVKPAYDSFISCTDSVSKEAIDIIGKSGGYYNTPPEKVDNLYISYYFYDGESHMPSLESLENEMQNYVTDMLPYCIYKNTADLEDYEINPQNIKVKTTINEDDTVNFVIDYSLTIIKNNKSYYFDKPVELSYNIRLYTIYDFISQIIEKQKKEPRAICVSCISDLSFEKGLFVNLYSFQENDITFYITDELSLIDDKPYLFFFVIKYPENNNYDPYKDW